jgi:thioredoxin-dependent peroxiredoxin
MSTLRVGDPAPEFALEAQDGTMVRLADFHEKQPVVLIFYPMDQTPGCTAQLCAARDSSDRYRDAGVAVFGVNNASAGSHKRFVEKHHLNTPLLVDEGLRVAGAYGAAVGFGRLRVIRRTVVGISPDGKIIYYRRGSPSTDEILSALSAPAS